MNKPTPILWVLILSILFILTVLLFPALHHYIWYISMGALVLAFLLVVKAQGIEAKYDRILVGTLLLVFLLTRILFRDIDQITLVVRTASLSAFMLLNGVLLIGPWSRFSEQIRKFYVYRRHMGVTVLLLGSVHAALVFSSYFTYSPIDTVASLFPIYGIIALFMLFWMGLTSWDVVQKKISPNSWKVLHAALLFIYLGIMLGVYRLHRHDSNITAHLMLWGLLALFWLIIAPYSLIKKIMSTYVFGWKQIHVLIYLAYISLLIHAWLGFITLQNTAVKILFWLSPLVVFSSHLLGWIQRWREDRKINHIITHINQQFEEDGKTFVGVAYLHQLTDNIGTKTYINSQPLALFKQGNTVYAISNLCAHQKGPLHQGKVVHGAVVCPWHYWKYNLKNGEDLWKEFCLPSYEVRIKSGVVFVSTEPVNKGKIKHC